MIVHIRCSIRCNYCMKLLYDYGSSSFSSLAKAKEVAIRRGWVIESPSKHWCGCVKKDKK